MKLTKKCIIGLASCVLLILQAIGLKFDVPVINEVISGLASILVMLGIISDGTTTDITINGGTTGTAETESGEEVAGGDEADEETDAEAEKEE